MAFLDSDGLKVYTAKIKNFINSAMIECGVATFNGRAGVVTPEAGDYSVDMVTGAAPTNAPVFTGSISMGRSENTAVGTNSVALGINTKSTANGSLAEGGVTQATGIYSHAEGNGTKASNSFTHAEGASTEATGVAAHAEGSATIASASYSHAEGRQTEASNFASCAIGKFNKIQTAGGNISTTVGDVFNVGNGTTTNSRSNALRLAYEGTLYLTKAYKSTGADYAEYFEWLDGNPDAEDRVGHFVTLKGTKIVYAEPGDYVLGVVSGQPCIIGNADEDWLGRWVHDDFNRFVKEYLLMHEVEVTPPEGLIEDELVKWLLDNSVEERDGHYFKMEEEIVDYPTPHWRHKANPSYDATQPYIERQDRKEWDAVGMVGVLSVIDDGSCVVNGYATVSDNGVATNADTLEFGKSWRVIERVTANIVKIALK